MSKKIRSFFAKTIAQNLVQVIKSKNPLYPRNARYQFYNLKNYQKMKIRKRSKKEKEGFYAIKISFIFIKK